ncbi:MAG: hypothetical protein AVDCRST_MAG56-6964, partial [uncultured Cytophagales bacterium]
ECLAAQRRRQRRRDIADAARQQPGDAARTGPGAGGLLRHRFQQRRHPLLEPQGGHHGVPHVYGHYHRPAGPARAEAGLWHHQHDQPVRQPRYVGRQRPGYGGGPGHHDHQHCLPAGGLVRRRWLQPECLGRNPLRGQLRCRNTVNGQRPCPRAHHRPRRGSREGVPQSGPRTGVPATGRTTGGHCPRGGTQPGGPPAARGFGHAGGGCQYGGGAGTGTPRGHVRTGDPFGRAADQQEAGRAAV